MSVLYNDDAEQMGNWQGQRFAQLTVVVVSQDIARLVIVEGRCRNSRAIEWVETDFGVVRLVGGSCRCMGVKVVVARELGDLKSFGFC